jgi:hypothetical protein
MLLRRLLLFSLVAAVFVVVILIVGAKVAIDRAKPSIQLTGDEQMTLYSIDPASKGPRAKPTTGATLRDYSVLGKVEIVEAAKRKEIADRINQAVANRAESSRKCFEPRHAIHVTLNDQSRDFLICFECLNMTVYGQSGFGVGTNITDEPKSLLNKLLTDAGIKLSPARD